MTERTAWRSPASGFIRSFRKLNIRPERICVLVPSFRITIYFFATITTINSIMYSTTDRWTRLGSLKSRFQIGIMKAIHSKKTPIKHFFDSIDIEETDDKEKTQVTSYWLLVSNFHIPYGSMKFDCDDLYRQPQSHVTRDRYRKFSPRKILYIGL